MQVAETVAGKGVDEVEKSKAGKWAGQEAHKAEQLKAGKWVDGEAEKVGVRRREAYADALAMVPADTDP